MNEHTIKRFWDKVDVRGADECWLWTAAANRQGYGKFRYPSWGKSPVFVHRLSYFLATGVVPTVCRHTCDTPACVNPAHLLNGTHKDNVFDCVTRGRVKSQNATKTHCRHGHPYNETNTGVDYQSGVSTVTGKRRLSRRCRTCHRERARRCSVRV